MQAPDKPQGRSGAEPHRTWQSFQMCPLNNSERAPACVRRARSLRVPAAPQMLQPAMHSGVHRRWRAAGT